MQEKQFCSITFSEQQLLLVMYVYHLASEIILCINPFLSIYYKNWKCSRGILKQSLNIALLYLWLSPRYSPLMSHSATSKYDYWTDVQLQNYCSCSLHSLALLVLCRYQSYMTGFRYFCITPDHITYRNIWGLPAAKKWIFCELNVERSIKVSAIRYWSILLVFTGTLHNWCTNNSIFATVSPNLSVTSIKAWPAFWFRVSGGRIRFFR